MADDVKTKSANRRSLLEENFRQKRKLGLQSLRGSGLVSLLVSLVTVGFGAWNVVVAVMDGRKWPYVIPIGCIAGILIWIIFVSALYNFIFLLLCCAGSVLGIVLCVDDHSNCEAYGDSKMAISVGVTTLSLILWLFSFFYTRWYFVYSRAFGFKSKAERLFNPKQAMELQKLEQKLQTNHQTTNQANGQAELKSGSEK